MVVAAAVDKVNWVVVDKATIADYDKESLDLYWDSSMNCNPTPAKQAVCTDRNF